MTVQNAQARAEGMGQLYLDVTVTDAVYSNPRFILGGVRYSSTNAATGAPVCPAVLSWGSFNSGISADFDQEGTGSVSLDANAYLIPSNGTTRLKVGEWVARLQFRESEAALYQWNATESTQELLWKGFIVGVTSARFSGGVYSVELVLSTLLRDLERADISDVITKASFSAAPISSLGLMVPKVYGRGTNILSATDVGGGLARCGFPMPGVKGVVIDENQSTAKVKVRFSKNDGVSAWSSFPSGSSGDAGSYGGLWVYDAGMGCYGMVDAGSYSVTNDVDKAEVVVDTTPTVYFYIRPTKVGSTNAAGFTDSYKIIDTDPNNYVVSDAGGNHTWAFYMPSVNFNGRVKSVSYVVDWFNAHATKNRTITMGVWDIYAQGGAAWLGVTGVHTGPERSVNKVPGDPRIISQGDTATYRYNQSHFAGGAVAGAHKGSATRSEFSGGTFITRDTGDANEATLEIKIEVQDLGGANSGRESVRVYNVGMLVEVDYAFIVKRQPSNPGNVIQRLFYQIENQIYQDQGYEIVPDKKTGRERASARILGTDFFARGAYQKDDGSGTYTGSPSAVIERVPDIASHIIAGSGHSFNSTAATLGNFTDPRSNGVLQNLKITKGYGPNIVKRQDALKELTTRFPMRLRRDAGTWHCIPDDINPHSSRVYRTTSEVLEIGPNDIDVDSFSDREIEPADFVNSVQLNYSHGYPDADAAAQTTYDHPLSQKWFGKKTTDPYDYPELHQNSLEDATDSKATELAQWLGRRVAMPRRIVSCSVFQKFYDLEPGHCLGFKDLETIGIVPQAFRTGLCHYYFNSSAGGTDYGDSTAAVLISLTSSTALIGLPMQVDRLTFSIQTAAAFTPVANPWRYSSSGGFSNFSGVTNSNGLQSTGTQTITWTRPNWWDWIKSEQTLGGTVYGPCYWIQFNYTAPTVAGLCNDRVTYPATWRGRIFEVLKADRRPGRRSKDYPFKDVQLMEVM